MYYEYLDTPIGRLLIAGEAGGLRQIGFPNGEPHAQVAAEWRRDRKPLRSIIDQLERYFEGDLQAFEIDLAARGTPFRKTVWNELSRIPYGVTISYGELARRIGKPSASRAVGAANGANPLPIVVPCHRVIGSNGTLTGFGGGLPTKQWLLAHERKHAPRGTLALA